MWKGLALLVFAISLAISPQPPRTQNQSNAQNCPPGTVVNNAAHRQQENCSANKSPEAHAGIEWANWALVIVGGLTFLAILYQSKKTAVAAEAAREGVKAALLNAQAVINTERPWIVVTDEKGEDGYFSFFARNVGKGAAEIISINSNPPKLLYREEKLPPEPEYYEGAKTHPFLLPPGEPHRVLRFSLNALATRPQQTQQTVIAGATYLFALGRIRYIDLTEKAAGINTVHETRWCRWYIPLQPEGRFINDGYPEAYSRHT